VNPTEEVEAMRKFINFILPVLLLMTCVALVGAAPGAKSSAYSTEVSIQPGGEGVFVLKAKVKDLASGEVIAGPMVKMPAGETAKTESTLPDSDTMVTLSANIDAAKHSATYTITVKSGKSVVSEHSANVAL
jgi:hypothetical protein